MIRKAILLSERCFYPSGTFNHPRNLTKVTSSYKISTMKKALSLTIIVAAAMGVFVYAQVTGNTEMPISEEIPKAMTKEEAAKISDEEWKKRLTPEQYYILRKSGTEPSNSNIYSQFQKQGAGIYVCAGCNTELFSSKEKFDSRSGWPSFYGPSKSENVKLVVETDGSGRIEVRCAICDGHLGHAFSGEGYDTPTDQRYCINGSALKFVPEAVLKAAEKVEKKETAEEEKK